MPETQGVRPYQSTIVPSHTDTEEGCIKRGLKPFQQGLKRARLRGRTTPVYNEVLLLLFWLLMGKARLWIEPFGWPLRGDTFGLRYPTDKEEDEASNFPQEAR